MSRGAEANERKRIAKGPVGIEAELMAWANNPLSSANVPHERIEEGEVHDDWGHPPDEGHDCREYAIHGPLALNHHKVQVEECMKCNRWRALGYGVNEWQPAATLQEFIRKHRP